MARLVAVTGASGFIGSALVPALQHDGWQVRALVRRNIQLPGVEHIHGDLQDDAALERLVHGCDAIIHCAGRVRGARARDFQTANSDGTARLIQATASQSPQSRLLYLSTLAAREPQLSWYADSKRRAEALLAKQDALAAYTIFRPTAVYGPGDREIKPLFTAMRHGYLPVPGGRLDSRVTLLHVDDLVGAIRNWLTTPSPASGPYELHDGTPDGYTWPGIRDLGEQILRRRIRLLPIGARLLGLFAYSNLWLARLFGYAPMLTPAKLRELCHPDWRCDNSAITRDLDWHPQITLADSLRQEALSWAT